MDQKKRVLKLVEEGKLSAEEALTLLEGLENESLEKEHHAEKLFTELSTDVQAGQEQKHDTNESDKHSSTKTKIFDFIDSAVKKIKDLDLDFNFGHATPISHIFQHQDVFLRNIDLDVANGSVQLIPWDERDVRVECNAKVYRVESQTLARETFLQDVLFSIESGKLRFSVQKKQMKVNAVVYVPKESYEFIKIRMFNGPIMGENLDVKDFRAKTANGKISINGITSNIAECETANGHIKITNGHINDLEAETINGTIRYQGTLEKLDMQSFNGNIDCELFDDRLQTAFIKTTAGNVTVFLPTPVNIDGEFKSNLGAFTCDFEGKTVLEEKKEVVQKLLRFKVDQQAPKHLNLYVDSKAGSIKLRPLRNK